MKPIKKKFLVIIISVIVALALIIGACAIYLGDYYRADEGAIMSFAPEDNVSISVFDDETVVFEPKHATTGFIFYPGGKVEHNAYQPLMSELAKQGILCVLIKMPFNLAVFDINAADGIQEKYPHISKWYIGGHSLGGSMAASYLSDNIEAYEGLILLGSYSTANLSETDLDVLSVYGSEDRVLNVEKYDKNKHNLPKDFTEVIIEGGNHAQFGLYGKQSGDGEANISSKEQVQITVKHIVDLINT